MNTVPSLAIIDMGKKYHLPAIIPAEGIEVYVDPDDISVDQSYQREIVSQEKIKVMAENWNPALAGRLTVVRRPDKTLKVPDGQHRLRAAQLAKTNGKLTNIPVIIFESTGRQYESGLFVALNTLSKHVTKAQRHKASIAADDEDSIEMSNYLKSLGLSIYPIPGSGLKVLNYSSVFVDCDEQNSETNRLALEFNMKLAQSEKMSSHVHNGLMMIFSHGLFQPTNENVNILLRNGPGYEGIKSAIKDRLHDAEGKSVRKAYANGILDVYNKYLPQNEQLVLSVAKRRNAANNVNNHIENANIENLNGDIIINQSK